MCRWTLRFCSLSCEGFSSGFVFVVRLWSVCCVCSLFSGGGTRSDPSVRCVYVRVWMYSCSALKFNSTPSQWLSPQVFLAFQSTCAASEEEICVTTNRSKRKLEKALTISFRGTISRRGRKKKSDQFLVSLVLYRVTITFHTKLAKYTATADVGRGLDRLVGGGTHSDWW